MFITKKHISRRTILKGAGCCPGATFAGRDGAGRDGASADGGGSRTTIFWRVRMPRRGPGLLGA